MTRFVPLLMLLAVASPLDVTDGTSAFTDVHVVVMDGPRILQNQTVLVRNGRIVEVGPTETTAIPPNARRIEGRGRYLLPGLVDTHVHLTGEEDFFLYLANGVTTVRNMAGRTQVLTWKKEIANGDLLGPTIYTTGHIIDGDPPTWPGSAVVETTVEADSVVRQQVAAGYDAVKVYDGLSTAAYLAIVAAAEKHGVRVVGHVPEAVDLELALEGHYSIEHLSGYSRAVLPEGDPAALSLGRFDAQRVEEIAAATAKRGVWNVPTLVVVERTSLTRSERRAALLEPVMELVPPPVLEFWRSTVEGAPPDRSPQELASYNARISRRNAIVLALHDAGARILLGTDAPNPFVVPGFSVHTELGNLVAAGLSPYEALRASIRDPAVFLGGLDEFGTVEVGKRADVLLVEENPLENLETLRSPIGVMVRGRWLDREDLRAGLEGLIDLRQREVGPAPASAGH